MKRISHLILIVIIISSFSVYSQNKKKEFEWLNSSGISYNLYYTKSDSNISREMSSYLNNGIKIVEEYFSESFAKRFDVYVFPSRQSMDEQWSKDWGISGFKSECWMVASGVAHRLDLLSLSVWNSEACEHNSENKEHVQNLITHELVHVFHGQNSPVPDFTGMDDLGWFVEGLAVLVSGQLDSLRIKDLSVAKEQNKLPAELKNAWSGKYRYAVSGSLVGFVKEKWGKETFLKLMKCTNENEVLKLLSTTENELLEEWKQRISIIK